MTSRFVAESGSVIHVEDAGSGAPVLALHGLGGGAFFFRGFARRLASRARVIAVDLPGTGRSTSAIQPFTLDSWAKDLGDLVRTQIGQPVVIVGHSLGTILALQAWQQWPDRIRAIVFANGLPRARADIRERLALRAASISQAGLDDWGDRVAQAVFGATAASTCDDVLALFERVIERQDPHAYVRSIHVLNEASASHLVTSVTVPCLLVTGSEDFYAPPPDVRAFAHDLPGTPTEVVLTGSGHMPFYECADRFAGAVERFLERLA